MKEAPWCVEFPRTVTRQQGIWCGLEGKGKEGRRQDQKGQRACLAGSGGSSCGSQSSAFRSPQSVAPQLPAQPRAHSESILPLPLPSGPRSPSEKGHMSVEPPRVSRDPGP